MHTKHKDTDESYNFPGYARLIVTYVDPPFKCYHLVLFYGFNIKHCNISENGTTFIPFWCLYSILWVFFDCAQRLTSLHLVSERHFLPLLFWIDKCSSSVFSLLNSLPLSAISLSFTVKVLRWLNTLHNVFLTRLMVFLLSFNYCV